MMSSGDTENKVDNSEAPSDAQGSGFPPDAAKVPVRRMGIAQEFWLFMKENKVYWMAPIILVMFLLILLVVLAPTYAPGVYTLF